MAAQNYKNHIRWYIPHHFVLYPLAFVMLAVSVYFAVVLPEQRAIWLFAAGLVLFVTWLSFMLRQHYGMTLQNRLVLLELRYRYFVCTQQRFELLEQQLSFGQRAALRFAPDEELPALAQRTVNENLSPDAIKRAIVNWRPDYRRI